MKLLLENKKIAIIVLFVLICGILLQLSRSQFILETAKNNNILQHKTTTALNTLQQTETLLNAPYCILYHDDSLRLKNNVEKTLQYMKKSYRTYDVALAGINLKNCDTVLHTTAFLEHLGSIEDIEDYVKNGGKLMLLQTLEPSSHFRVLHPHFGILQHNFFTETKGIQMTSNLLIGANGKQFLYDSLDDVSLNVVLKNDIDVYIRNTQNLPIAWKAPFQKGYFVIFNANMLSEKMARGIIAGLLSITEESYIYPIFNTKTFYIDDFPAPIPLGTNEIIYNEYERDLPDFFKSIWWPDMIKTANKFNLTYTGAMIQTYNDRVTPPFETSGTDELNTLIRYGRELIQSGGELGYHGYNHQSLTMDTAIASSFGYNAWQSEEHMISSLRTLNNYAQQAFPSYSITSYVPPSNVLSEVGRSALKKAIPSLVTINSLYGEDGSERSYIQEFDIGRDQIINMPRVSSGYFPTDTNEWSIANAINLHGVFSHFIHPDDVISIDRSKGSWGEMHEEFEIFMNDIHTRYPWLRSLTATTAAYLLVDSLTTEIQLEQTDKTIKGHMQNFKDPQHFILRLSKKVKSTEHCTIEKIDENTYLVIAYEANFKIHY